MTSHSISLSRHIAASVEQVWKVVTDIPRAADTLSGVTRVEMFTEPPYGVGTRWRETRTMFGKQATEEMWVTAVNPPRSTVVEAESAGTHYTTSFTIEPEGQGSTLTLIFAGEMVSDSRWKKLLWKAFGKIGVRASSKAMTTDLADIAAAAEKQAEPDRFSD
ncbi:SRPBCC family protein [Arthrobacter pigmenti]